MSGARRWVATLSATAVVAAVLTGCGDDATPAQQVPALTDALARVDAAASADDDARLRRAVAGLVRVTEDAEQSGDLDTDDADGIRDAAAALLDAAGLASPADPDPTSSEPVEPLEPSETTTSSAPAPPEEDGDEDEDGEEEIKPEKPGKPKKHKGDKGSEKGRKGGKS